MSSHTDNTVSTGAGIAIFGVWIACVGLTVVLMLILFVWGHQVSLTGEEAKNLGDAGWIVLAAIIAPIVVAFFTTKVILNRD